MSKIDHASILADIRANTQAMDQPEGDISLDDQREEILGLKFHKGDIVQDLTTGDDVEIIAGNREAFRVSTAGEN